MSYNTRDTEATPILLLKTRAADDGYQHRLALTKNGLGYRPAFVPILDTQFHEDSLNIVRELLEEKQFGKNANQSYGGLIFTSQRAVEAFAKVVKEGKGPEGWPYLKDVPIYVVGPATSRALRAIKLDDPFNIFGAETGDGERLAEYIIDHYAEWYFDTDNKHPLLFLVGEKRRDIIPKILMDPSLMLGFQIKVEELVVYGTGVKESFEGDFRKILQETGNSAMRWVVVFSPTGCEAMLRALDLLDPQTGKAKLDLLQMRTTYIATIGPTTRDCLRDKFGFEPDVCAKTPDPEGVEQGIKDFLSRKW